MKLDLKTTGLLIACLFAMPQAGFAQPALDADAAAGKIIFEETAGGVGCQQCHAMDATGDVGPDIRGRSAADILNQLQINENMTFIELSQQEAEQVSAYLAYLDDL